MQWPAYNGDPIEYVSTLVSNIDEKTWMILIGVFVAFAVLKVIISGIKRAILLVITAAVVTCGGLTAHNVTSEIGITVKDGIMNIDNSTFQNTNIAVAQVDKLELYQDDYTVIAIVLKDGTRKEARVDKMYYEPAKVLLGKLPVDVEVKE